MADQPTASPPTQRVLDILNMLAAAETPLNIAGIADPLELSRSTVAAILSTLEERGWVVRYRDRTYRLGSALAEVGERARAGLPLPSGAADLIEALGERLTCDVALSMASSTHLVFVYVTNGHGRIPTPLTSGARLPLRAPMGAGLIAHAATEIQQRWLQAAPPLWRNDFQDVFAQIRQRGVIVWGIDVRHLNTITALAETAQLLLNDRANDLYDEVFGLLTGLSLRPYLSETIDSDRALPVGYMSAPVFNNQGEATWELQVGPMNPAMSRQERDQMFHELSTTAKQLSRCAPTQP